MFLNDLLDKAYLSDQPATQEEILLMPSGLKAGIDMNMVVPRAIFEETIVKYRASEPTSEAILMAIGRAKDISDPVWNTLLSNECVVTKYTELCNSFYASQLEKLEGQNAPVNLAERANQLGSYTAMDSGSVDSAVLLGRQDQFVPPTPQSEEHGEDAFVPPATTFVPPVEESEEAPQEGAGSMEESELPLGVGAGSSFLNGNDQFADVPVFQPPASTPTEEIEEGEAEMNPIGFGSLSELLSGFGTMEENAPGTEEATAPTEPEESSHTAPDPSTQGLAPAGFGFLPPPGVGLPAEATQTPGVDYEEEATGLVPPSPGTSTEEVEAQHSEESAFVPPVPETPVFTAPAEDTGFIPSQEGTESEGFVPPTPEEPEPIGFVPPTPVESEEPQGFVPPAPTEEASSSETSSESEAGSSTSTATEESGASEESDKQGGNDAEHGLLQAQQEALSEAEQEACAAEKLRAMSSVADICSDASRVFGQYGVHRVCEICGTDVEAVIDSLEDVIPESCLMWRQTTFNSAEDANAMFMMVLSDIKRDAYMYVDKGDYDSVQNLLQPIMKLLYKE